MKIIDLLNKIANEEEVPKKIIYENVTLEYDEKREDYYEDYYTCYDRGLFEYLFKCCVNFLNDEVEIIEEPKEIEIPKHLSNEFIQNLDGIISDNDIKCIAHKVNEIINYLQYKEKKEEQED